MSIKKTTLGALALVMLMSILVGGCTGQTNKTSTKTWYQQIADELRAHQPSVAPDNLWPLDGAKNGTEFDVNMYFSVLTHLSMQDGYELDYVYLSDGTAGGPILYIRPTDAAPFQSYNDYRDATHQNPRAGSDNSLIWLVKGAESNAFGNKISVDGTKEGYFEYAALQTVGNKFYLFGYAQVSDTRIVCEKSGLDAIIKELESSGTTLSASDFNDFKKAAGKIDLTPKVDIAENTVTVTLTAFSVFNGFTSTTIIMLRNYPNSITSQKTEVLLPYNNGK
jgi:hypothetical protein